jgi:hypothetical protein
VASIEIRRGCGAPRGGGAAMTHEFLFLNIERVP